MGSPLELFATNDGNKWEFDCFSSQDGSKVVGGTGIHLKFQLQEDQYFSFCVNLESCILIDCSFKREVISTAPFLN